VAQLGSAPVSGTGGRRFKSGLPDVVVSMIEMTSAQKGELAMLKAMTRAVELGWIASRPTRDCRYDLILDDGVALHRVQVKYCARGSSSASGVANLDLTKGGKRSRTYLDNEIDAIVVYVAPADRLVWLGKERFHNRRHVQIRYESPRNGQTQGILMVDQISW
jgi:hypothetical protein